VGTFTNEGTENRMRWDRRSRGFMEVWYSTITHRETGAGLWVRYTLTSPIPSVGDPYCEVWGFFFDPTDGQSFAAKQRFPIDALGSTNGRDDGALVRIGDSWLSETHMDGAVVGGARTLRWSLDLQPADSCFQHLPASLRDRIEKRVSTVCSPNLSVPFTGVVELDGRSIAFDKEPGCQSHRWGRKHSVTWTWAHCASFEEDADAVFEGLAAKTAFGPLPGPTTTLLYLRFGGDDLVFNELRWALRARSRYEMPTWAFTARNENWRIAGAARARVDRMIQIEYADPDGTPRFCANSEVSDLAIEIYRREQPGWRHVGSLTSLHTAHLEFGKPVPFVELPIAF
jgi:hypothetical protein